MCVIVVADINRDVTISNIKAIIWKQECQISVILLIHDDVIKWEHFPHYWPFVRGIHRSPVNSPHKGQWHGTLNKRFSKQSGGWWFEMPSRPLWRHCNVDCIHRDKLKANIRVWSRIYFVSIYQLHMYSTSFFAEYHLNQIHVCAQDVSNVLVKSNLAIPEDERTS